MVEFLYSGHESFSLRISWLPKAVGALERGESPFSDPRVGMTTLGLGKNMIQSLSFWVVATGLAVRTEDGLQLTEFARKVLGRKPQGFDPYLENSQTLWLLHWNLCQGWAEGEKRRRPYAWQFFMNVLNNDEITATEAIDHFAGGPVTSGKDLSPVTLRQHFDVFVRTYAQGQPAGPRSTPEDILDSPLTTIGLLRENGDRKLSDGRRETVYRFSTGRKASLSHNTFRYSLHQWWDQTQADEKSLTVRQISLGEDSPGRCFRLPEAAIHRYLIELAREFPDEFELTESRSQRGITRRSRPGSSSLLSSIYRV
jgi:hypothetical protein